MNPPIDSLEAVRARALKLPSQARLALADELYVSLSHDEEVDPPLSDAWQLELERRIREVREGKVHLLTKEEFFASLDSALERSRKPLAESPVK